MSSLDKALYDYHNTDKTITTILQENNISKNYFYRHLDYKEDFRAKKKLACILLILINLSRTAMINIIG